LDGTRVVRHTSHGDVPDRLADVRRIEKLSDDLAHTGERPRRDALWPEGCGGRGSL
jgi:hypothetical protein